MCVVKSSYRLIEVVRLEIIDRSQVNIHVHVHIVACDGIQIVGHSWQKLEELSLGPRRRNIVQYQQRLMYIIIIITHC